MCFASNLVSRPRDRRPRRRRACGRGRACRASAPSRRCTALRGCGQARRRSSRQLHVEVAAVDRPQPERVIVRRVGDDRPRDHVGKRETASLSIGRFLLGISVSAEASDDDATALDEVALLVERPLLAGRGDVFGDGLAVSAKSSQRRSSSGGHGEIVRVVVHVQHHVQVGLGREPSSPREREGEDARAGVVPAGLVELEPVPRDVGQRRARSALR